MNYSYQREKILECVLNSCEHPTAEMVYEEVKKEIPTVSLGTIYRNLNTLNKVGKIKKISIPNYGDRFDKTTINHCHIHCIRCNKAEDILMTNIDIYENIEKYSKYHLLTYDLVFQGICDDCYKLEGNEI